jgi:hypothetical protein
VRAYILKMNLENLQIVEVYWTDAAECGIMGWNDPDEILSEAKAPCPTVRSVGYLLYESEAHIALLRAWYPEGVSSLEKIPKGMVSRIEILRGF